jgi:hypothetical protein
MTYVVLKEYQYDPIDCIRPTVAIERESIQKRQLFSILIIYILVHFYFYILVLVNSTILLVSDLGSVSSFGTSSFLM